MNLFGAICKITQTELGASASNVDTSVYAVQQMQQFQKRVQGVVRFLDRLEHDKLRQTAAQLPAPDRAETLSNLRHLRAKIDAMLDIMSEENTP